MRFLFGVNEDLCTRESKASLFLYDDEEID